MLFYYVTMTALAEQVRYRFKIQITNKGNNDLCSLTIPAFPSGQCAKKSTWCMQLVLLFQIKQIH